MATLTLTPIGTDSLQYTLTGLNAAYVDHAIIYLLGGGSLEPVEILSVQTLPLSSMIVNTQTGEVQIIGQFVGFLTAGTRYTVSIQVYDASGQITSERAGSVWTFGSGINIEAVKPYRVDYTITGLVPAYVDHASVDLYLSGGTEPVQTQYFDSSEIAGATSISGYFESLDANTTYRIWAFVWDSNGEQTATRNETFRTPLGLTLFAPSFDRVDFVVTDLLPNWVQTATVTITKVGESSPVQTRYFRKEKIAGSDTIYDYFTGLTGSTRYSVRSIVYDSNGNQSSDRTATITTPAGGGGGGGGGPIGPLGPGNFIGNPRIHTVDIQLIDSDDSHVYNTFDDWGLIAAEVPYVAPPSLKSKYVDLPTADGMLDYTELLLGNVPFGRRTGTWRFYTDLDLLALHGFTWDSLYLTMRKLMHGRRCYISLTDDPDYYYEGRVYLKSWKSLKAYSEIAIDYNLSSYKFGQSASDDYDWQWDDAIENPDFEILYGSYVVDELRVLNAVNNGDQPVVPTVTCSDAVTITVNLGLLVQRVLLGDYGNGQERWNRLEAEGYCWQIVQNAVEVACGYSPIYTVPSGEGEGYDRVVGQDIDGNDITMQDIVDSGMLDPGTMIQLVAGENYNTNLVLNPGDNVMVVTGSQWQTVTVTFSYREAGL